MTAKLTLEEKTWHGCKYYTVQPFLTSWSLSENNDTWNKISQWCYDTYGQPADPWDQKPGRWYLNNSQYWFREESDRTMFILRWS
jgi:hypothetical protein